MKNDFLKSNINTYKHLGLLVALYIICFLLSTIFASRLIEIRDASIPGGLILYAISILILDIVTEIYGYREAKKLVFYAIISMVIYAICAYLINWLPSPAPWRQINVHYAHIDNLGIRASIGGISAVLISQFLNAYILSKSKVKFQGKHFLFRVIGSTVIGDIADTTIASSITYYGLLTNDMLTTMWFANTILLVSITTIGSLPAAIIVNRLKKAEGIDTYDTRINYNPFK